MTLKILIFYSLFGFHILGVISVVILLAPLRNDNSNNQVVTEALSTRSEVSSKFFYFMTINNLWYLIFLFLIYVGSVFRIIDSLWWIVIFLKSGSGLGFLKSQSGSNVRIRIHNTAGKYL